MVRWIIAVVVYWTILQVPTNHEILQLPSWWNGGRIIEVPIHVGIRPAFDYGDMGVGITIQISAQVL